LQRPIFYLLSHIPFYARLLGEWLVSLLPQRFLYELSRVFLFPELFVVIFFFRLLFCRRKAFFFYACLDGFTEPVFSVFSSLQFPSLTDSASPALHTRDFFFFPLGSFLRVPP